jgi:tripartite-type tricarboxylate transporter receptor subunit TctC
MEERTMKIRLIALMLGAICALATPALAGSYPEKPVTIVFPNQAGSGYHTALLAVLDEMKDQLPVAVSVSAMPGAGTSAGTRYVQEQSDDGYTLLFIHEAIFTSSALGMLGFEPLDEFEAVARVVTTCAALYASSSAPYNSLEELEAYSKSYPGAVRAAINTGAISHVEILSIKKMTGADIVPVHVAGGTNGFTQAVLAGDVDIFSAAPGSVSGLVESGDIKPIVYFGKEPYPGLPGTPTLASTGYGDQDVCIGGYFWIRRSAPEEAKAFWENAIQTSLTPEAIARLDDRLRMDIGFVGRKELDAISKQKYEEWTGMMKEAGVAKQ